MDYVTKRAQRAPQTTRQHLPTDRAETPTDRYNLIAPGAIETAIQEQKLPRAQRIALAQRIDHSYGNRQLQRMLSNRTAESGTDSETNEEFKPTGSLECTAALKPPPPIQLSQSDVTVSAPGDYPLPSGNSVMAMRIWQPSGAIQREESGPSGSAQIGTSLESGWTFELEASYENLMLKHLLKTSSFQLDLNLSPKMVFAAEKLNMRKREISLENGWKLLEAKWMPPWQRQISAEISAYAKHTLIPHLQSEYGGKGELTQNLIERKIKNTTVSLNLKLDVTGAWKSHDEETKRPGIMWSADPSVFFKVSF
jgi:hypothetical protein